MSDNALALIRNALNEVDPGRATEWDALDLDASIESLGLDSVRLMEMVGAIEEAADVTFPDEALPKLNSLGDLARLIREA